MRRTNRSDSGIQQPDSAKWGSPEGLRAQEEQTETAVSGQLPWGSLKMGIQRKQMVKRQERIFVNIAMLGRWRVSISVCLQHTDKSFRLHGGRIGTGARGMHN
jgi:hypothetical protein